LFFLGYDDVSIGCSLSIDWWLFTNRYGVTLQETWIVINTDEISSNLKDRTLDFAEFTINIVTTDNSPILHLWFQKPTHGLINVDLQSNSRLRKKLKHSKYNNRRKIHICLLESNTDLEEYMGGVSDISKSVYFNRRNCSIVFASFPRGLAVFTCLLKWRAISGFRNVS
jgi:hypothetical protein